LGESVGSKWEKHPLPEIEGKSTFTRVSLLHLMTSVRQRRDAITSEAPSFFVMNAHDLLMVLSEKINLTDFLRIHVRLLAEERRRVCSLFKA